jgi:putative tricarboxylic transport membrane protein
MGSSVSKGLVAVLIGCLIALVGPDPVTGQPRLTFGVDGLEGGIETVPALIGLLALREIFLSPATAPVSTADARRRAIRLPRINLKDLKDSTGPAAVGTGVGLVIGALPGAGPTTASFISYRLVAVFRRWRRPPGEGSLPAIAATDASQNASGTSGLIPTFALGIPGDPADVLILAALTTQGLIVGPNLAQSSPGLLGVVSAGLLISSILMVVFGYLSIWPSSFFAAAPQRVITYATLVAVMTGVYAYRQSLVDVWVTLGTGLLGFAMGKVGMPVAPAALALVLGSAAESDLRRGLIMTDGFAGFLSRPVTLTILIVVVLLLLAGPARAALLLVRGGNRSDDESRRSEHV